MPIKLILIGGFLRPLFVAGPSNVAVDKVAKLKRSTKVREGWGLTLMSMFWVEKGGRKHRKHKSFFLAQSGFSPGPYDSATCIQKRDVAPVLPTPLLNPEP